MPTIIEVPETFTVAKEPVVIAIRNSDRATYRRCRRKWDLQSALRQNLVSTGEQRAPLWFGSGIHFALEDYHGYNRFGDPRRAFDAYVTATNPATLPPDVEDHVKIAEGMLEYYVELWLPKHVGFETLWVDGVPQVEVDVQLDITNQMWEFLVYRYGDEYAGQWWERVRERYAPDNDFTIVVGQTFDRVLVDDNERIWGMDYKTARQFSPRGDLERNGQAAQYYWGLTQFYPQLAEGLVWQQHLKTVPEPPDELKTGGFSLAKNQSTTYSMYHRALIDKYGKVPKGYIDILNHLASLETEEGDKFVRRDYIRKNEHHGRSEEEHILLEVHEMLDPDVPIYPNPTRDCNWDCPFRDVSAMMDDGSDWEWMLRSEFVQFVGYDDSWRKRIKWPEEN